MERLEITDVVDRESPLLAFAFALFLIVPRCLFVLNSQLTELLEKNVV